MPLQMIVIRIPPSGCVVGQREAMNNQKGKYTHRIYGSGERRKVRRWSDNGVMINDDDGNDDDDDEENDDDTVVVISIDDRSAPISTAYLSHDDESAFF